MLEILQVQKWYGDQTVLSIPYLQLPEGIYWLRGSNGSGKTTFLRMIAGLLPFRGDIVIKATSLRRQPVDYRRSVSWADAEPLYPDFLKGRDLVAFYREVRKASAQQVDELTDLFQVRSYLPAPIGTYSSGMVKRLSLVLAFIGRPTLITLDEPLVTLDQDSIPLLYDLITRSYRENNTSFLISSHQDIATGALPEEKVLCAADQTITCL
ncbi:MAG TPA: ATP-binding cassette domain-containing protein [Puia sp.]|jgi:ABC-2 type transport system ATP-binding protein|nr:ATP-binding cassette domain-containing protein [Puia sp.]